MTKFKRQWKKINHVRRKIQEYSPPEAIPTTSDLCVGKVMPDQSCGHGSVCFGPDGWEHPEWVGCKACEEIGVFSELNCDEYLQAGFEDMYNGCMINCFGSDELDNDGDYIINPFNSTETENPLKRSNESNN